MFHYLVGRVMFAVCVCAVFFAGAGSTVAGGLCCALCGKTENCERVCRVVQGEKKITINCWACEEEEICLPGASKADCRHCEIACDVDDEHCQHAHSWLRKCFVWSEWSPCSHPWLPCTQPRVVTKKKLMKKTVTRTVPSYKWVLEELCPDCEAECEKLALPDDVLIPPPPKTDDARILMAHPVPPAPAAELK